MNHDLAHKIADTVLYEGYMLYPYRPSAIKNRQRWTFGILYPPTYDEVRTGTERSQLQIECLLQAKGDASVGIELRFLHLLARQVLECVDDHLEPVASLSLDGHRIESWDHGIKRSAEFEVLLGKPPQTFEFAFPGNKKNEPLYSSHGQLLGQVAWTQQSLQGNVCIASECVDDHLWKLKIEVANASSMPGIELDRNTALLSSLLSVHAILTVRGGDFVSLLDPPEELRELVKSCVNAGSFPVLVGYPDVRDMMLCSPILLYDYPQIAHESAGDFYDATEMDEMLTLRVLTLTEQEKDEMRCSDDRVRELLQRTEESAREQLIRTHGVIRGMRPVTE